MTSIVNKNQKGNQKGFSLVEILVSIAVVSIGLMSVALMTTKTIQTSKSAHEHAVAIMWAESFSQKIMASVGNQIYLLDEDSSDETKTSYNMNPALTCYNLLKAGTSNPIPSLCSSAPSTAATLAAADIAEAKKIMQDDVNRPLLDFTYVVRLVREDRTVALSSAGQPNELNDCNFYYTNGSTIDTNLGMRCALMVEMSWRDKQINPSSGANGDSLKTVKNTAMYQF
jgi:prepilin-type N-terminal cleavage/methylation domain-containing protein